MDEGLNELITMRRGRPVSNELNLLALIKGTERFVFVYDDASRGQLLDTVRHQASDPAISLNWFDASLLSDKAKEQIQANQLEVNQNRRIRP